MLVIGLAIGSLVFPESKSETTIQQSMSTTTATTTFRAYSQETISEIIIEASGINGGAAFCEGNLSTPTGCIGGAIDQFTSLQSTDYVFPPSSSNGEILNATLTTTTIQGVLTCNSATTYTTTVSYNLTSGYGRVDWSWTATGCSITTYSYYPASPIITTKQ